MSRGAIATIAALLFFLSACGGPALGTQDQLRQWVETSVAFAEAKERRNLLSMVSPNYGDGREYDRDDIGNKLRVLFLRLQSVKLLTSINDIRVFDDSVAEIDLTVGMAGKNDSVFGFSADAYKFELELERDGDDWLLISARWGEVGDELR